ncbi:hypothetical protein EDF78_105245 [Rahnella sp. BIGb0236]|uniref:T6SS immunity protein Tli3 family protein n=1 Tax=Rahnella sp. BIGb0236 TaxID=2485117 RepID=UPI001060F2D5|nr:hypothetical protein [Rahnella sp. BIGb0236]TDS92718.1 hypothetical protein EDF78_105245 [Rahnella sp. BIGb0236]VTQ67671.1 Uncharacterised protein [Campylobacter jejuni]
MKKLTLLAGALVFSLTSLNSYAVTPPPMQTSTQTEKLAVQPIHNPSLVIYRIDKNRYLTLEDYSNCDDGSIYYHNDNKKIKTKLWFLSKGTMNYKGKFIWAAKNDDMLAIPLVSGDNDACGDSLRGCAYSILSASIDGGKKFSDIKFGAINSSSSKNYTIVVTDDAIYFKSNLYPSTDKYAINSNGEFYNVRQAWIQDEFYKGMLKLGVPEDVLVKKNPLGYSDLRLTNKYHYSEAQNAALIVKAAALFDKYNDSPITEKLPDLKQDSSASNRFSCKTTLQPSQPKNQG